MTRARIADFLDPSSGSRNARLFRGIHYIVIGGGIVALALATVPWVMETYGLFVQVMQGATLMLCALEYVLHILVAPSVAPSKSASVAGAYWHWAASPLGIIDLLAVAPMAIVLASAAGTRAASAVGIFWLIKFARYSHGIAVLSRVIPSVGGWLFNVFKAFLIVLFGAATLAYIFEGEAQPEAFGSIPSALWWAVVTLTTTGYGDVTPTTVGGRILAGTVMICGIAVFALWAGILATGFAEETRRYNFLRTWDLVAKVPLFKTIGAGTIAEVARLLRPREVPAGAVIMRRGESGDCMYFIVSGEVEIRLEPNPVRLGAGDFFGEIALISDSPRTATAVADMDSQLLILDIADFRGLMARQPDLVKVIETEAVRRLGIFKGEAPKASL
ncbi:MAG: cyclic nucleotide-binding domain-containing protein [Rhodospirillales bacterium]|nr:cyclic nucleotide-binding domain-containing protein [Rhodospirillales bacterium]